MIFALGLVGLFERVRKLIESFDGLVFWGWAGEVFIIGLPPIRLLLDVRFGGSSFALALLLV